MYVLLLLASAAGLLALLGEMERKRRTRECGSANYRTFSLPLPSPQKGPAGMGHVHRVSGSLTVLYPTWTESGNSFRQ